MLSVKWKDSGYTTFHINTFKLLDYTEDYLNSEVVCISADGDELHFIVQQFGYSYEYKRPCTIPYKEDNQVMTWYGDIAKTILANL